MATLSLLMVRSFAGGDCPLEAAILASWNHRRSSAPPVRLLLSVGVDYRYPAARNAALALTCERARFDHPAF